MNRPKSMQIYKDIDLKLGIKSSLPKAKPTLALLILLWLSNDKSADLRYSVQDATKIRMSEECENNLRVFIQNIDAELDFDTVLEKVESNCLFQSQLESLIVAFELVWKLAIIKFEDKARSNSAERTGNSRYSKVLTFTSNIDIIDVVVSNNENYPKVLLTWLLEKDGESSLAKYEEKLIKVLTYLSEDAICKLRDGEEDTIFNPLSVYDAMDSYGVQIDINGDGEAKGALRVIKSALNEGLNSYLEYNAGKVFVETEEVYLDMQQYAKRVRAYHSLQYIKLNADGVEVESEDVTETACNAEVENDFARNRIVFGAPGTGKSHRLELDSKCFGNNVERVTFHPSYSYANFVGTYKPTMIRNNLDWLTDDEKKKVIVILQDKSKTAQEKYDLLYDKFKGAGLTRLPILLGIYSDEVFKTRKVDGTDTDNTVERNHGKAIRPYLNLQPGNGGKEISYEYVPGPFMRIYTQAINHPEEKYLLLIEEINRANVAAVFGDVFQLLDRKSGVSEYPIATSEDIKAFLLNNLECLKGKKIDEFSEEESRLYQEMRIPDNMFIWATMNSADQGVFPMDTAFKRRWEFEYIGVDDEAKEVEKYIIPIGDKEHRKYVKWNNLRERINDILVSDECKVNEDKLLGPFFISKNMLESACENEEKFIKAFESKVIMYLFEDAMKMRPANIFKGHKGKMIFSEICKIFEEKGEELFGISDIEYIEKEGQE